MIENNRFKILVVNNLTFLIILFLIHSDLKAPDYTFRFVFLSYNFEIINAMLLLSFSLSNGSKILK